MKVAVIHRLKSVANKKPSPSLKTQKTTGDHPLMLCHNSNDGFTEPRPGGSGRLRTGGDSLNPLPDGRGSDRANPSLKS